MPTEAAEAAGPAGHTIFAGEVFSACAWVAAGAAVAARSAVAAAPALAAAVRVDRDGLEFNRGARRSGRPRLRQGPLGQTQVDMVKDTMTAADMNLVSASFELLDAAIEDEPKLARLLVATVADGWTGFPESLPVLRSLYATNPGEHAWGTLFFVLDDPRTLVGLGGYKGGPSSEGVVEIGYAIAPAFRGRGLATAAVQQMVTRGFGAPQVRFIDAHTLAQPNASTRVLEKSGFEMLEVLEDPDEGPIWHWRLSRSGEAR